MDLSGIPLREFCNDAYCAACFSSQLCLSHLHALICRDCVWQAAASGTQPSSSSSSSGPCWRRCVDLGCGTGLMGPLLRPHCGQLCGVDLSAGMVGKARQRGCYDELAVGELVQYLQEAQKGEPTNISCYISVVQSSYMLKHNKYAAADVRASVCVRHCTAVLLASLLTCTRLLAWWARPGSAAAMMSWQSESWCSTCRKHKQASGPWRDCT
jgi:SAM-dependent methyltransferase